jgi:hypothetical protein
MLCQSADSRMWKVIDMSANASATLTVLLQLERFGEPVRGTHPCLHLWILTQYHGVGQMSRHRTDGFGMNPFPSRFAKSAVADGRRLLENGA